MMKLKILFLLFFTGPSFAFADSTHVVQQGDTILNIADRVIGIQNDKKDIRRYQFARKIIAKNPNLRDPNSLTPGQKLVIPDYPKPQIPPPVFVQSTQATLEYPTEVEATPVVASKPEPQPQIVPELPPPVKDTPLEHAEHHGGVFMIQPRVQLDHYEIKNKSSGQKASLSSKSNAGLTLGYGVAAGEKSHVMIEIGASNVQMKSFSEEQLILDNNSVWLKNIALGFEIGLLSSVHLHLLAMVNDYPVIVPTEIDTYTVKSVMMPGAEAAFVWDFLHMESSAIGLSVAGEYLADGKVDSVKYSSGFEPAGTVFWKSEHGPQKTNYRVDLRYNVSAQKSELTEQHGESWGLRLGLSF